MSIVSKESIEVIAQSIGISNLSPDAALALAPDVEYRMREIMQVWFGLTQLGLCASVHCSSGGCGRERLNFLVCAIFH